MSNLTLKGDLVHSRKYEKDGETKFWNTNAGALFYDEEKKMYKVKVFDTWFNVFEPRANEQDYAEAKQAVQNTVPRVQDDLEDEIPF